MLLFQFILGRCAIFAALAFGFIGKQDLLQRILKVFAGNCSALLFFELLAVEFHCRSHLSLIRVHHRERHVQRQYSLTT